MKINHFEKGLSPIGLLAQDCLSGAAAMVKEFLTRARAHEDKMSCQQLIWLQSKANGCSYHGEDLSETNWEWPKNTWFQQRLSHHLKDLESAAQQAGN
jgi:hypothetical protein